MKHLSYLTRALKANDRRYARIFAKMGYETKAPEAEAPDEDIGELRATYEDVMGKKPFHGWDAATLVAKIAEKRAEG